ATVLATTAHRILTMEAGRVTDEGAERSASRHRVAAASSGATRTARGEARWSSARPVMIEISHLTRTYKQGRALSRTRHAVPALKGVDLYIERGTTLGLAGQSGCGKSTLARCVAGLERADSGRIWIEGIDVS